MIWGEKFWTVHLGVLNNSAHETTEQVSDTSIAAAGWLGVGLAAGWLNVGW